jgi:hypothetical protein
MDGCRRHQGSEATGLKKRPMAAMREEFAAQITAAIARLAAFVMVATLLSPQSFGQTREDDLKPLMEQLNACYYAWSVHLAANTCEPAATVVDAAFGSCAESEKTVLDAVKKIDGPNVASGFQDALMKSKGARWMRDRYLAIVLQTRINQGLCSGKSD